MKKGDIGVVLVARDPDTSHSKRCVCVCLYEWIERFNKGDINEVLIVRDKK